MGLKEDVNELSQLLLEMSSAVQKIQNTIVNSNGFVNWVPVAIRPEDDQKCEITNGGWLLVATYVQRHDTFVLDMGPMVSPDYVTHWAVIPRPE